MSKEMLDSLLAGKLRDPDGGGMLIPPLKHIVMSRGLGDSRGFARRAALLRQVARGRHGPRHAAVLGEKVAASLATAYAVEEIVLPRHPHPDMDAVNGVIAKTETANALIASAPARSTTSPNTPRI